MATTMKNIDSLTNLGSSASVEGRGIEGLLKDCRKNGDYKVSGERGRITGAGTVEARWRQRSKGRRRGAEPEAWGLQAVPVSVTKNGCNVSHLGLCLSNRSLALGFLLRTSQILDELYQKNRHCLEKALVEGLHHREGTTWSRVGCRIRGEPNRWAAILKDFLIWIKQDLGPWGPLVLIIAYVPLTVLAIPASILTLGGGYLFGLPLGVVADSVGATIGATAAFLIGRTVSSSTPAHFGRSFVISKLKNYPKFQAVAGAIQKSGFKARIIFLLRLVPLLPFNILNYLLSVTPVHTGKYMLASWLGMMPSTFSLVYVGTTLKDLSDVTHGWNEISATRWDVACHPYWFYKLHFLVDVVILMVCVAKVAKASLDKSLIENGEKCIMGQSMLPAGPESILDL
ncbi:hypothetical protein WN943_017007 [Citrus x changshan-huyou]